MGLLVMRAAHHPEVIAQPIDEETLLLRLDTGRMGVLNQAGGLVWGLMDGSRTLAEIAQACADHYGMERGQVEDDVLAYAHALLEREMIVLGAEPCGE